MGSYRVVTLFVFLVDGVFGDASGLNSVSVMEGRAVTLNTGVTKQQRDKMLWYFNDTLIALINGASSTSCLYDGEDGRFRDRVKVDYETGSLTITDIRSEHAGRYEANFIQSKSSGTSTSLNRNSKCDSTKITRRISNIGDNIKTFIVSVSTSRSAPHKKNDKSDKKKKEQESDRKVIALAKEQVIKGIKGSLSSSVPVTGLSAGVAAGVVVAVLILVSVAAVVGVIYYRRRSINAEVL